MGLLITIDELAFELHVSKSTIHRLMKGGLPCVKLGRLVRFKQDKVSEYLDRMSSDRTPLVRRSR